VEQLDQDPILDPKQVAVIVLLTLFVFFAVAPLLAFLNSSLALLAGEIFMILPAIFYVMRKELPVFKTFRIKAINVKLVAATAFLFVPVFILTDVMDRLVQQFFPMPEEWLDALAELVQFTSVVDGTLVALAAVIVAPIAEEMLFRGLVQRTLEKYRDPAMALVLTSVLFALVHFNPWTSIQITLLGLVLGYITWKSGSILPAIILHGLNNLFSLVLMNIDEQHMGWYSSPENVKILWIALAFILIFPAFQFFNSITEKR
jgi:membrane protease YdiL (CAAX protease family)